jgi:Ca2+-binding EF-hand superfamily protein
MKITALSKHIPGILNNYIRIFCWFFQKIGERVTEDQLHDILNEVDVNKNAQVDMHKFQMIYLRGS